MNDYVISVIVAILGSSGIWAIFQSLINSKIKQRNDTIQQISDKLDCMVTINDLDELRHEVDTIKTVVDHNTDLTLSVARDKINALSNRYMRIGYIPMDEYVSYIAIGESYINANGNTEIKSKFLWCKEHLEPKDPCEA